MDVIYTAPTWAIVTTGLVLAAVIVVPALYWLMDDDPWMASGIAFFIVALFTVGIPMAMRESADYATWCEAQGGYVDSSTQVGVATTGKGAGTAVTVTTYCLTTDGRIIDVS